MIKTFIAGTPEELDSKVNDFMIKRKENLPVRDGCDLLSSGKMLYRAMVFYTGKFNTTPEKTIVEEQIRVDNVAKDNTKPEKVGALWVQNDKSITGTFREAKIIIPDTIKEKLVYLGVSDKLEITMKDEKVRVIRNKFKKTDKHPDYVIFLR